MKIFLDFDDVIFNTRKFAAALPAAYQALGISPDLFQKTYQVLKEEHTGQWIGYSVAAHSKKLQEYYPIEEEELAAAMSNFLADTSQFVFADTRDFLRWCQEHGYEVYILSFGDPAFQNLKIKGIKLSEYLKKVIVTEQDKSEALLAEGITAHDEVWFFDDRLPFLENVKRALPSVQTVLVARPEGRYTEEVNEYCDYRITSLQEGKEMLTKMRNDLN